MRVIGRNNHLILRALSSQKLVSGNKYSKWKFRVKTSKTKSSFFVLSLTHTKDAVELDLEMYAIRKVVVGGRDRFHIYISKEAVFLRNYSVPCAPSEPIEKKPAQNALHGSSKSFCSDSKTCYQIKKSESVEHKMMGYMVRRHEAENMEELAVQNFVKDLLNIADALSKISPICLSLSLIDLSHHVNESAPALYRLLEHVSKTTMQLKKVFEKFGVKRIVPDREEQFDPARHIIVRRVTDCSLISSGRVALVQKPGYMHYDRVLRKSEVWIVVDEESETEEYNDEAKVEEKYEMNHNGSKAEENLENFLNSLLDTADSLIKVSVMYPSIISSAEDIADVLPALQIYLEEIVVAEKKLTEALKVFGIERFISGKEPYDPHRDINAHDESAASL